MAASIVALKCLNLVPDNNPLNGVDDTGGRHGPCQYEKFWRRRGAAQQAKMATGGIRAIMR